MEAPQLTLVSLGVNNFERLHGLQPEMFGHFQGRRPGDAPNTAAVDGPVVRRPWSVTIRGLRQPRSTSWTCS
eukprot:245873-Amphidinium_carterae.1